MNAAHEINKIASMFFESAVGEISKMFPGETGNLIIGKSKDFQVPEDVSGLCHSTIHYATMEVTNVVVVYPNNYKNIEGVEELIAYVMDTAAHEMAHHIDITRLIARYRNKYCHAPDKGARAFNRAMQRRNGHGRSWKTILNWINQQP